MHDRSSEIRYSMSLGQPSDHYAALNGFREWRFIKATKGRAAANEYAFENLMHVGGLQTIEKTSEQMLEMLVDWNLVRDIKPSLRYNNELGDPELNINSDVQPLSFGIVDGWIDAEFGRSDEPCFITDECGSESIDSSIFIE